MSHENHDRTRDSARGPEAPRRLTPLTLLWGVLALSLAVSAWQARNAGLDLPYSEFRKAVESGKVSDVSVGGDLVTGRIATESGERPFRTVRVPDEIAAPLDAAQVEYTGRAGGGILSQLLVATLPLLLIAGLWLFFIRRAMTRGAGGPGFMSIGKSTAKIYAEDDIDVSFRDVAGVDEAVEELREVVSFLRDPTAYGRLGARMPKGILLVGPPGTGKTLLGRAVAGEAGVPFFNISGSEFVEMFVGVGAARVRDLFQQARAKAPCIIFIDELDALGRARGAFPGMGGHDEKEQTLNQLLVELDGFEAGSGVVLLAATNRPEVLDPALLRPGRFDRQVLVDRPDKSGRLSILRVHADRVTLAADTDLTRVADLTPGFSGADLANLVNEAALLATRRGATRIEAADFTSAIERIVGGLEKRNRLLNPRERDIVAHHEMGHAIVASGLSGTDPVHKVSIIPRGIGALGYTLQRPTEERFLMTRAELERKLAVLLGGRAAESLVFGHLSTGAADDLARATDIAYDMVTRYALVPELGNATYASEPRGHLGLPASGGRSYSEATSRQIDGAVRGLVDDAAERARAVLEENRELLIAGARELIERETLDEDDLARLFASILPEREAA